MSTHKKTLRRLSVGGLPLIHAILMHYQDEPNDTLQTILELLDISQDHFWAYNGVRKKNKFTEKIQKNRVSDPRKASYNEFVLLNAAWDEYCPLFICVN